MSAVLKPPVSIEFFARILATLGHDKRVVNFLYKTEYIDLSLKIRILSACVFFSLPM